MLTVWAVEWGNEFPAEIDSLWTTQERAKEQADKKNAESKDSHFWKATQWVVRD